MVADGLISGRFRLAELLGTGGSASVFAAVDTHDEGAVALKILHPHLSSDDAARQALFAEARAAASLRHPNIVRVIDVGVHDDSLAWIALELVAGVSLGEYVDERGPLDAADALTVLRGILFALGAAHDSGLIHRDVSPANVMISVTPDRRIEVADVRLVDFGLADAAGRPALSAGGNGGPAGVVGNANYLSPEQAEGREIDGRGDLYQAGAVLYFALTGTPPFERSTIVETMRAHVSTPPPVPSVGRGGVPRGVDRLVVKAMLKHPEARFQSAREMLAAIDALAPVAGEQDTRTLLLGAPSEAGRIYTTRMLTVRPPATRPTSSRPAAVPLPAVQPVPTPEGRSPAWAIIGALAVIVGAIAWILSATAVTPPRTSDVADAATLPTPSVTAVSPIPSAPAQQAVVAPVAVPDVTGGTVAAAGIRLQGAALALGSIVEEASTASAGTVLRSSPEAASAQPPGTAVSLVVASGFNTVPLTVGLSRDAAIAAIQNAGFTAQFIVENDPTAPRGSVLRSEPADATSLELGRAVTIIVSASPAPSATPSAPATPVPSESFAPFPGG
ncbi:protein kinase domain-containing protein [Conyzicola sp.]|uniref:protein kinase domain-containing protein n=1 Tax=Conyzicola sp. TaxID=1969404 RepID=UPI00398A39B4